MNNIVNNSIFQPIDRRALEVYNSCVNFRIYVMENVRILLADDNKNFRSGLAEFINNQLGFKVVGEANDGMEAIKLIDNVKPDIVLLDVSMPKLDGISTARFIRKECSKMYIVIVTMHEEKVFKSYTDFIPVDGFINKSEISEKLPKLLTSLKLKLSSVNSQLSDNKIPEKKV